MVSSSPVPDDALGRELHRLRAAYDAYRHLCDAVRTIDAVKGDPGRDAELYAAIRDAVDWTGPPWEVETDGE